MSKWICLKREETGRLGETVRKATCKKRAHSRKKAFLKKFFANFNNGQYSFLKGEFRSYWRTSCQITEKNSKVGKIRKTERSDF